MVQLMRANFPVRARILISAVIGVFSGVFCWFLMVHLHLGAGDFVWTLRSAQYWLQWKKSI